VLSSKIWLIFFMRNYRPFYFFPRLRTKWESINCLRFMPTRNPGRGLRTPYTTVFWRITWSSIKIVFFRDCIRRNTIVYGLCKRPFLFLRLSPYFPVYDTEIYDRNTGSCKSSYYSVYGRLRPCVFQRGAPPAWPP
jgi:hypothetical protein